ncbi:MAG: hypothetical protein KJ067_02220 [Vicinamibacteria bacterium]|nr:hypothetical protein [Vicinamibacteria bacterium]
MPSNPNPKPGQGSNLHAFLSLVGFVLFMWMFWNIGKPWAINWALRDEMVEAARSQPNLKGNDDTYEKLDQEIAKLGLDKWLTVDQCEVTLEGSIRRVKCTYERDVEIIFGIKRKVTFENEITTPVL